MQMEYRLPSLLTAICDNAIAVKSEFLRDLRDHGINMPDDRAVLVIHLDRAGDMLLRHHQKMSRSLRIEIEKCIAEIILIDLLGRDLPCYDFAENAITHHNHPITSP